LDEYEFVRGCLKDGVRELRQSCCLGAALLAALVVNARAQAPASSTNSTNIRRSAPAASTGVASWYGGEHSGKRTASGERFNPDGFTAAHPRLPFGTRLRVSHNGRTVVVRVNDRGPFTGKRALDLSRGAAQALGMISRGAARVSWRVASE
jgi:rare lipoprotein A